MRRLGKLRAAIGRFARDQRGVTAPLIAIFTMVLSGIAGYAIDMGHVLWVQRQLQASADAAALAGALYVATDPTTATSTATTYSGKSGSKNEVVGASSETTQASPKCFTSITAPACTAGSTYNGIVVTQTATVPTFFLKIFGLYAFTPKAVASASAKGGMGTSLNVMVMLDTTASMNQSDPNCSIAGATKLKCAQAGAQSLLQGLSSATSQVGFMTYPPLTSSGVSDQTTCNGGSLGSNDILAYNNATITGTGSNYLLVGLTNGFGSASNPAAILVGNGGKNCNGGIQARGGVGTYFADAINAAQAALTSSGSPNAQNVIIVLSDGDANASSSNVGKSKVSSQCQQAVTNAQSAATAGTWVYTVAYGANSNGSNVTDGSPGKNPSAGTYGTQGCSTDTGLSPCDTMKNMASDSAKFYSDDAVTTNTVVSTSGSGKNQQTTQTTQSLTCTGTGGNSTDLVQLFKGISSSLTLPRLIPNDTI